MGSKIEYVESSHMYATNYIRNSKAIGVLWGIFTICYAIIGVVAFVTPEWIGDLEHENPGRFGLWSRCSYGANGNYVFSLFLGLKRRQSHYHVNFTCLIHDSAYSISTNLRLFDLQVNWAKSVSVDSMIYRQCRMCHSELAPFSLVLLL